MVVVAVGSVVGEAGLEEEEVVLVVEVAVAVVVDSGEDLEADREAVSRN